LTKLGFNTALAGVVVLGAVTVLAAFFFSAFAAFSLSFFFCSSMY
jgi:hypothetical protein